MTNFFTQTLHALKMSFGMFWEVGWSLALGFMIASVVQVLVPRDKLMAVLGGTGFKPVATATALGAISSSCSYASASVARTLFRKGVSLTTSLAFLFASTNLVIELGIILFLLLGWQFMAAEWIGGIVLIAVMSLIIRLTYPKKLIEEARANVERVSGGHEHMHAHNTPSSAKSKDLHTQVQDFASSPSRGEAISRISQHFLMDVRMLWKDIVIGFLIAGFLSTFVPHDVWQTLFVKDAPAAVQVPLNAMIGPLIAVISFVCSIGNVPMAAVLWGSGISFGGVLAFIYADLIVLPLLDVYRRYFGLKMAAYIGIVFYVTMVITGIIMDVGFEALGFIPEPPAHATMEHGQISLNYTFWLNLIFGVLTVLLIIKGRKGAPKKPSCCGGHGH